MEIQYSYGIFFGTWFGFLVFLCIVYKFLWRRREKTVARLHLRKRSLDCVPTSPEEIQTKCFSQAGHRFSYLGAVCHWGWRVFLAAGTIMMILLTLDVYFGFMDWTTGGQLPTKANQGIFFVLYCMVHLVQLCFAVKGDEMEIFFLVPCEMSEATYIKVTENSPEVMEGESDTNEWFNKFVKKLRKRFKLADGDKRITLHPVKTFTSEKETNRYFEYTCIRYIWNHDRQQFRPYQPPATSG